VTPPRGQGHGDKQQLEIESGNSKYDDMQNAKYEYDNMKQKIAYVIKNSNSMEI